MRNTYEKLLLSKKYTYSHIFMYTHMLHTRYSHYLNWKLTNVRYEDMKKETCVHSVELQSQAYKCQCRCDERKTHTLWEEMKINATVMNTINLDLKLPKWYDNTTTECITLKTWTHCITKIYSILSSTVHNIDNSEPT